MNYILLKRSVNKKSRRNKLSKTKRCKKCRLIGFVNISMNGKIIKMTNNF